MMIQHQSGQSQQHQQLFNPQIRQSTIPQRAINGWLQSNNKPSSQLHNQLMQQQNLNHNQPQVNKRIKTIKKPSLIARAGRNVVEERKNSIPTQNSEQPKQPTVIGYQNGNGAIRSNANQGVSSASSSQVSNVSTNNTVILGGSNNNAQNINRRASNNANGQINKNSERKQGNDKRFNQQQNHQSANPSNQSYLASTSYCNQCGQNGCNNLCGLSIKGLQIQNGNGGGNQNNSSNTFGAQKAQDSQRMRFQASAQNILNQSGQQRNQNSNNIHTNNQSRGASNNSINPSNPHINGNLNNQMGANSQKNSYSNGMLSMNNSNMDNQQSNQSQQQSFYSQNNTQQRQQNNSYGINGRNNNIRNIPIQELVNINNNQIQLTNHIMQIQNNNGEQTQYHSLTPRPNNQNHQNIPFVAITSNRHQRMRQAAAQIDNSFNIRTNPNNIGNQQNQNIPSNRISQANRITNSNQNHQLTHQNGNNPISQHNENQINSNQQNNFADLQVIGINTEGNYSANNPPSHQSFYQQSQQNQNNTNSNSHNSHRRNSQQQNSRRSSLHQPSSNGTIANNAVSNIITTQNNNSTNSLNTNQRQPQNQARYRIVTRSQYSGSQDYNQIGNQHQQQLNILNRQTQLPILDSSNGYSSYIPQSSNTNLQNLINLQSENMNQSSMSHLAMVNNEYFNLNNNTFGQSTNSGFFANNSNGYRQFVNNLNQSIIDNYNSNYDVDEDNDDEEEDDQNLENYIDEDEDDEDEEDYENEDQDQDEEYTQSGYADPNIYSDDNFQGLLQQSEQSDRYLSMQQSQLNFLNQINQLNRRLIGNNNNNNNNNNYQTNQSNNNSEGRSHSISQQQIPRSSQQLYSLNSQNHTRNNSLSGNYGYDIYPQETYSTLNQSQQNRFLPNIYFNGNSSNQQQNNQRRQYERTQLAQPQRVLRSNARRNQRNQRRQVQSQYRNMNTPNQNFSTQYNDSEISAYGNGEYMSHVDNEQISDRFYSNNEINNFQGQGFYEYKDDDSNSDEEQSQGLYEEEEEEKENFDRYDYDINMNENDYGIFQQYQDDDSQDQFDNGDENEEDNNDYELVMENEEAQNEDEEDENDSQIYENNYNITLQINSPHEINFNVNEINIDIDNQMFGNSSQISLPDPRFFNEFARNLMRDLFNRNELNNLLAGDLLSLQIDADAIQLQNEEDNRVPGLNQDEIDKMKTTFHSNSKTHKTCAICLSDFEDGEKVKELNCEHRFHIACIDDWLKIKGSCPLCRENFTQINRPEDNLENQQVEVNVQY